MASTMRISVSGGGSLPVSSSSLWRNLALSILWKLSSGLRGCLKAKLMSILNLVKMAITYPRVRQIFMNDALSNRRTRKIFAKTFIGITLEQTVNADATSRSTGIAAFNHTYPARWWWMITCSLRNASVGHLLSMCDMKNTNDMSKFLKPYRFIKDKIYLKRKCLKILREPWTLST